MRSTTASGTIRSARQADGGAYVERDVPAFVCKREKRFHGDELAGAASWCQAGGLHAVRVCVEVLKRAGA